MSPQEGMIVYSMLNVAERSKFPWKTLVHLEIPIYFSISCLTLKHSIEYVRTKLHIF